MIPVIRWYSSKNQEGFQDLVLKDHASSQIEVPDIHKNKEHVEDNADIEPVVSSVMEPSQSIQEPSDQISQTPEQILQPSEHSNSNANLKQKLKEEHAVYMKNLPEWAKRDKAIKQRYGQWNPTKKLTRQQIEYLRTTADLMPHLRTIDLASMYNVSPEAIRRILKSKWVPTDDEVDKVIQREEKRRLRKVERQTEFSSKSENFNSNKERPRSRPQSKHSRKLKRTVNRPHLSLDEMID
ncbi:putative required for respiratory growth protein 9, mitochondrial [[Candida] jaroonii]|uniref:Required for respiratory growth protein 9, mitochondrial n=1 Tax=[Candida] jaroonii TaxID=467808 RepID=A0ACA9YAJ4_9ASCO|nr:putative required for respiratory growth protein 9, mitochondrial [[Candida] jaroonii]